VPGDLTDGSSGRRPIGAITVEVVAYDWNCPKFITPRFTEEQVRRAVEPLQDRIRDLEERLARLTPADRT
jgi:hypothetical protein